MSKAAHRRARVACGLGSQNLLVMGDQKGTWSIFESRGKGLCVFSGSQPHPALCTVQKGYLKKGFSEEKIKINGVWDIAEFPATVTFLGDCTLCKPRVMKSVQTRFIA
jgi:hypothetical protein